MSKIKILETTLAQWYSIEAKEMAISSDLRNHHNANQAKMMISKVKSMIAKEKNIADCNAPELKRTFTYRNSIKL